MKIKVHWGTGIALVYIVFAVATVCFVTFAMSRRVDLVSKDYYARSLQQDGQMKAERNALSLTPEPAVVQSAARAVLLSLPRVHAGAATGTVTLYRASDSTADRVLALAIDANGQQRISLEGLAAGVWTLQVRWSVASHDYYVERAVFAR